MTNKKKKYIHINYTPEMQSEIDRTIQLLNVYENDYQKTSEETGHPVAKIRQWKNEFNAKIAEERRQERKRQKSIVVNSMKDFSGEIQAAYLDATRQNQEAYIQERVREKVVLEEAARIRALNINLINLLYSAKIKATTRLMEIIPKADNVKQLVEAILLLQNIEQAEDSKTDEEKAMQLETIVDVLKRKYDDVMRSKIEDASYTHIDQQGNEIRVEAVPKKTETELITEEDY